VFVQRPISAVFVALCVILIGSQLYFRLKGGKTPDLEPGDENKPVEMPSELAPQRLPAAE
jgi:hypothetical protein